jgi:hypothetical protein
MSTAQSRIWPIGLVLTLLVLLVPLGIAQSGGGGTASTVKYTGSATCNIATNTNSCTTTTITFPTAYSSNPAIITNITSTTTIPTATQYDFGDALMSNPNGNTTKLLFNSTTPVSATIPNTDTALETYAPSNVNNLNVTLEIHGYLTSTITSANQIVSIFGEETCLFLTPLPPTIQIRSTSTPATIPFFLKTQIAFDGVMCASVDVSAPAADASTTITITSFAAYTQIDNRMWLNFPGGVEASGIPLYGVFNPQFVTHTFFTSQSASITLCANVIVDSASGVLDARFSANPAAAYSTWSHFQNFNTGAGLGIALSVKGEICANVNPADVPANDYWMIFGYGGGGVGDNPILGLISISWVNTFTIFNVSFGLSCASVSVTPSSFKIKVLSTAIITGGSLSVTVGWTSIG